MLPIFLILDKENISYSQGLRKVILVPQKQDREEKVLKRTLGS